MSDIAIEVDKLGKCFEIGELVTFKKAARKLARPFGLSHHIETNLFWALKDVSFQLKKGEVLGVIGRNGAGKSTLLKVLSRITAPSAGRAVINGRVGSLLEVGTGFHPELTGRENVYLNGAILGMRRHEIDSKFDEIVAFAGTEKFIDTPVKRYSSGMKVRLAFAVAAHLEPEILICDEVLAVGDAAFQAKCLGKMGDVAKEGRTVLLVSHNMGSISNLCSRAIMLDDGQIAIDGIASEAINKYLRASYTKNINGNFITQTENGSLRVVSVKVLNKEGCEITTPMTGQPVCLEIKIETDQLLPRARLALGIEHPTLGRVSLLGSHHSGKFYDIDSGTHIFRCNVDRLSLNPGSYSINFFLAADEEKLLEDPSIFTLDVIWGNDSGQIQPPNLRWAGVCNLQENWTVE